MTSRKIAVLCIQEMTNSMAKTTDGQNVLNKPDAIGGDLDNFSIATRCKGNKQCHQFNESGWVNL